MTDQQPTNSDIMKELGDVKHVLSEATYNVLNEVTNAGAKMQAGIDARTDSVLGRIAASRWSTSIVLGWSVAVLVLGWLIGRV